MGTFDPLGRLQGLTLIMHCIKYVLNVYYDIVWGPENANSSSYRHYFSVKREATRRLNGCVFFWASIFFGGHWANIAARVSGRGHSWEAKFLEPRICTEKNHQILRSKNLDSHECPGSPALYSCFYIISVTVKENRSLEINATI